MLVEGKIEEFSEQRLVMVGGAVAYRPRLPLPMVGRGGEVLTIIMIMVMEQSRIA